MNKNNEEIEVGDLVDIQFTSGETIMNALILGKPVAEGDCWKVKQETGHIIYVQHFETIALREKGIA